MKEVTIKKMFQIIRKAGLMPYMETESQFRKYMLYLQNKKNPLTQLGGKLHITVNGIEYKIKEIEKEIIMKDLKVYYKTEDAAGSIDAAMDKEIERIAGIFGLKFQGSGVEVGKGIRDLHYRREK